MGPNFLGLHKRPPGAVFKLLEDYLRRQEIRERERKKLKESGLDENVIVHQHQDVKTADKTEVVETRAAVKSRRERVVEVMDGKIVTLIMTIVTIFALYGDDIKLAALPKNVDYYFEIASLISLSLFTIELIIISLCKPGYIIDTKFGGFFFWLDLIATVSLLPDIGFIWEPFLAALSSSDPLSDSAVDTDVLSFARAGRAARAGTRAGRIVRIVRVIRMVRVVSLIKRLIKDDSDDDEQPVKLSPDGEDDYPASVVFQKLSDLTSKKVIIGVLLILLIVPLLAVETIDVSYQLGLDMIHTKSVRTILSNGNNFSENANLALLQSNLGSLLETYNSIAGYPLIFLNVSNNIVHAEPLCEGAPRCYYDTVFRSRELDFASTNSTCIPGLSGTCLSVYSEAIFDASARSQSSGIFGVSLTTFVIVLLGTISGLLSRDMNTVIIRPIERMTTTVKKIAKDPFTKLKIKEKRKKKRKCFGFCQPSVDHQPGDEMYIVESALVRVGSLMQIGFGEAGADILAKNMSIEAGEIDPMVKGKKVEGIFGFFTINGFEEMTIDLREQVMTFVNKIAGVIHYTVDKYNGFPNASYGDKFLVGWKFSTRRAPSLALAKPRNLLEEDSDSDEDERFRRTGVPRILKANRVNNAVKAVAEILEVIHSYPYVHVFPLGKRFPQVFHRKKARVSCGLNIGWAIEGAIGSSLKVDASYLSPHVNVAARLDAATTQYGTPLLFSGEMFELLDDTMKSKSRLIDCAILKGTKTPVDVYTYDLYRPPKRGRASRNSRYRFFLPWSEPPTPELKEFYSVQRLAISKYKEGNWQVSKENFEKAIDIWPLDHPSRVVYEYMSLHNFQAPSDWQGFRRLSSK